MSVVPESLVKYIMERMQEGHHLDEIRLSLLQYGYDPNSVDTAVSYISKRKVMGGSKFSTSNRTIVAISAAMIVLFFVGGLFFSRRKERS